MRLFFLSLIIWVLCSAKVLFAQSDSSFVDTVVIFKDPHVIRHQVVVQSPSDSSYKFPPIKFGVYFGMGNNQVKSNFPNVEIEGKSFSNFGLLLGCKIKNLELMAGAGFLNISTQYSVQKSYETVRFQKETIILSENTITITDLNGEVTKITTTKYGEITREIRDTNYFKELKLVDRRYFQIPVFLGYAFKLPFERWKITPGIQVVLNKPVKTNQNSAFENNKYYFMYGFFLNLEYRLNEYFSVDVKGSLQQNKFKNELEGWTENWNMANLNLGINYLIGNY